MSDSAAFFFFFFFYIAVAEKENPAEFIKANFILRFWTHVMFVSVTKEFYWWKTKTTPLVLSSARGVCCGAETVKLIDIFHDVKAWNLQVWLSFSMMCFNRWNQFSSLLEYPLDQNLRFRIHCTLVIEKALVTMRKRLSVVLTISMEQMLSNSSLKKEKISKVGCNKRQTFLEAWTEILFVLTDDGSYFLGPRSKVY